MHDYGEGQSDVTVHLPFLDDDGAPARPPSSPQARSEQAADAGLEEALGALERLVTGRP